MNKYRLILQRLIFVVVMIMVFGGGAQHAVAAESTSAPYVPLIGITSVPDPLVLPQGGGTITYHYAVKNFLKEAPLTGVRVTDTTCGSVEFVTGDDNRDSKLDYNETWRYSCAATLSRTTQSVATAMGSAYDILATHHAYATVVVGSNNPPPLVSIINITKIAYPLSLPAEGGDIIFTYRVNNPGVVPLRDVSVKDDKCRSIAGRIGDRNGNSLLDVQEVWIYTCMTHLTKTTTNTVRVTAYANNLKATSDATVTVVVAGSPNLPDTGIDPNLKVKVWGILSGILAVLSVSFVVISQRRR